MNKCTTTILGMLCAALMTTTSALADNGMPSLGGDAHDWSGLYVGATAGHGSGEFEQRDDWPGKSGWEDMEGLIVGGTIGYNVQKDHVVLGVEGDVQFSDINGSFDDRPGWTCIGNALCQNEVNWFSTIRGRIGYAFGDFLPFATAGLAIANVHSTDSNGVTGTDMDKTVLGFTAGGGVEMALGSQASIKLEALHIDLDVAESGVNKNFRADNKFNVVRAGLNWHF